MASTFSTQWKASTQPRKQRKYRRNSPAHTKGKFVHSRLSKELATKNGMRSLRLRKGDSVKIMRGGFKGRTGIVQRVSVINEKVYITGIELTKKDGAKVLRPIHPSNLLITQLHTQDKRRLKQWAKTTSKD